MKRNKNIFGDKGFLSTIAIVLALVLSVGLVFWLASEKGDTILSYSDFVKNTENANITEVLIQKDNLVTGTLKDGSKFVSKIILTEEVLSGMVKQGINVKFDEAISTSWLFNILMLLIVMLLGLLCYFAFVFFKGVMSGAQGGGNGKIFSVGKSRARFYPADSVKTKFSDVAGIPEVKEELWDVIDFLRNPARFKHIGAKIPRGVLLEGNPGNGKTLLAKAVAGEAGCPFLSISGSDFVEVFVGVGASRVRDLFIQARKNTPCIVFIDEIDTVGKQRGSSMSGGNEEREQTLNQLLSEMDGFATEHGEVVVLAATNRVDILDKALLRPGRFDKIVNVPYPDIKAREQILNLHAKAVKLDDSVDLSRVARGTPGCTGADLANLLNEAALIAVKGNKRLIDMTDLEAARDKMILGAANNSMIRTKEELRETAFHEAGHALLNMLLPDTDPFHKVTIVARGHALGVSVSLPEVDVHSRGKKGLHSRIIVCLGGLLAEKMILGTQTTGVASDLKQATNIARNMVLYYGMSDMGSVSFDFVDNYGRNITSEATAAKIDSEVDKIIAQAHEEGERLIRENIDKLHALAQALLENETVDAQEAYKLLGITPRAYHSLIEVPKDKSAPIPKEGAAPADSNDNGEAGEGVANFDKVTQEKNANDGNDGKVEISVQPAMGIGETNNDKDDNKEG
jgi:cell division protease FtsH